MVFCCQVAQSFETPSKNLKNFFPGNILAVVCVDDCTPQHPSDEKQASHTQDVQLLYPRSLSFLHAAMAQDPILQCG